MTSHSLSAKFSTAERSVDLDITCPWCSRKRTVAVNPAIPRQVFDRQCEGKPCHTVEVRPIKQANPQVTAWSIEYVSIGAKS